MATTTFDPSTINQAYQFWLGRTPNQQETAVWQSRMAGEGRTPQLVWEQIGRSPEALKNPNYQQNVFSNQQRQQRQIFNTNQATQGEQAIQQLQQAISGQPTLSKQRETIAGELGLPQLRQASTGINQAIVNLQQTLAGLPQMVEQQKRGYDVTGARLAQLQRREAQPLEQSLANLGFGAAQIGQQLSGAESELSTRLGLSREDMNRQLLPAQYRVDLSREQLAREASGFDQQQQNELQLYRDKIAAGEALDQFERQRAANLALAEKEFQNQMALNRQQADIAKSAKTTQQPSAIEQSIMRILSQLGTQNSGNTGIQSGTNNPYVTYVSRPNGPPRPVLTEAGKQANYSASSIWGF